MIKKRKSRQITVGGVKIGGGAPVSVQSMVKVATSDVKSVALQIRRLEKVGCEIVRVAVKNMNDAKAVRHIKSIINIPLVCDIHFDHCLALKSIENGADKIRINPGNMRDKDAVAAVVKAARRAGIPIRIGVNSGSVDVGRWKTENRKWKKNNPSSILVDSALDYIRLFEDLKFRDIIISLKASNVVSTVEAYRKIAGVVEYPLHVGVTASGSYDNGIVKSSIGIGSLLLDGIGDTIRVSLTADPIEEVIAAKRILSSLGIRRFGPEVIACPTCGRCKVDLVKIVGELENKLSIVTRRFSEKRPLTIAVMGCEVNGPGEAKEADIGIAFGNDAGVIFKKGKILKKVKAKDSVRELINLFLTTSN